MHALLQSIVTSVAMAAGCCALALAEARPETDVETSGAAGLSAPQSSETAAPAGSLHEPAAPVLSAADVSAWLDGYIPYAIATGDIVGGVVTVVKDGAVLVNRGYGYADLERRVPVDPDKTLFRPGSISKLFTWTAIMQLVERGELDLDADIDDYIDFELPAPLGTVTLRHIMTHTPGFEESLQDLILTDAALGNPELGTALANKVPAQIYAPGGTPAYSNYATSLAGHIVERISGQSFPAYVEKHIFEPLDMRSSTFRQPLPAALEPHMSAAYESLSDGEPQPFELIYDTPAGALTASGADMARFMIAHLAQGEGLISPQTAQTMHDTLDVHFPSLNAMALGFYQQNTNGMRVIGHGGATNFFKSDLSLILDAGVGIFISLNSAGAGSASFELRENLRTAFMDRYFPVAEPEPTALPTAAEHGRALAGVYEMSRRSASNAFAAMYMMSQIKVTLNDKDEVELSIVNDLNGAPRRWREVRPWVWQAAGGGERLAARVANGRVEALTLEPMSPIIVLTPVPWHRSSAWLIPALLVAAAVLALTLLAWPVRAFARRRFQRAFPYTGARALAYRAAPAVSFAVLAYLAVWAWYFTWAMSSFDNLANEKSVPRLAVLYGAFVVPLAGTFVLAWINRVLWRERAGWSAKLWAATQFAAVLLVVWFALAGRLASFDFTY